jgi:hypothetical protein
MKISMIDRDGHLTDETRRFAERRVLFALSRFDSRIDEVFLVLADLNGPRGGVDKTCRITVRLQNHADVIVTSEAGDIKACLARAAGRAGRSIARLIERRQTNRRRRVSLAGLCRLALAAGNEATP